MVAYWALSPRRQSTMRPPPAAQCSDCRRRHPSAL